MAAKRSAPAPGLPRSKSGPSRAPAAPSVREARPETVLLAVTGMSPAVLTETVWALAHPAGDAEPVVPARVVVVTTVDGRRQLEHQLFAPDPRFGGRCPWDALRDALAGQGHDLSGRLRFGNTGDDVRVITAEDPETGRSRELADLRTPADNEAAADFLLEQVRGIVENPDTHLVASLAGGRKTMGALLYACLTLVARETDRLTHVLVSEPFETLRGFWFPGQPGGALGDREGKTHDPASARVDLAEVPFVPLRSLFQRERGRLAGRFGLLVDSCREQVRDRAGEHVRIAVEQGRPRIEVNGTAVDLSPREHLVLLFLAVRAKRGEAVLGAYKDGLAPLEEFRQELRRQAPPQDFSDWRHGDALRSPVDPIDDLELRRAVSGIRTRLAHVGGNAHLLIPCLPGKGRFSLSVPGPLIHLKAG